MASHVAITGGAGGIGLALGRAFGRQGARVVLLDVAADRLAEAEITLKNEGIAVETAILDITDAAACERTLAAWPTLDLLINNAGISHRSLFVDTHPDVLRQVMEVNFFGAVHCTRAALPALRRTRGTVVALSTVAIEAYVIPGSNLQV